MAAALLVSAQSCKHSEKDGATDDMVEKVEEVTETENFTITLDDTGAAPADTTAASDTTAKKKFFAGIKEFFKSSRKEMVDSTADVHEMEPEEIQEEAVEEQPVEAVEPVEVKLDTLESGSVWQSIDPLDLEMKPVKNFAQDWMALVVGKKDNGHNAMTIAWGTIGQLWNKPVVIVYVSEDRYTKHLMDACDMFSVVGFPDKKKYRDALLYIGSHSQKDEPDKTENAGLTVERTKNGTPVIAEGDLAIECRKIYEDAFDIEKVPSDVRNGMYQETGIHHMYIGEIVSVLQKK